MNDGKTEIKDEFIPVEVDLKVESSCNAIIAITLSRISVLLW